MSCRTVPKKVSDFLVRRWGRKYCDSCIQERLGLRWRQQVQLITATLAVTLWFEREQDRCCTCNESKQVIYSKSSTASAASSVGSVAVAEFGAAPLAPAHSTSPLNMARISEAAKDERHAD